MSDDHRPGSSPRGFRPGAALTPTSTELARLYAERITLFNELAEAFGTASPTEADRLAEAVFALDRRILAAKPTRLADLGVKARVLKTLHAGLDETSPPAARLGFATLVAEFLVEIETALGSPVERASGIAGN